MIDTIEVQLMEELIGDEVSFLEWEISPSDVGENTHIQLLQMKILSQEFQIVMNLNKIV